jgi:hypothetical protein
MLDHSNWIRKKSEDEKTFFSCFREQLIAQEYNQVQFQTIFGGVHPFLCDCAKLPAQDITKQAVVLVPGPPKAFQGKKIPNTVPAYAVFRNLAMASIQASLIFPSGGTHMNANDFRVANKYSTTLIFTNGIIFVMDTEMDSAVVVDERLRKLKGQRKSYKISSVRQIPNDDAPIMRQTNEYTIHTATCVILVTVIPDDEKSHGLDLTNVHKLSEDHYTRFVANALTNDVTFKSQDNLKFLDH